MQSNTWVSLSALVAAIMAIGLGIAALVLALDDDGRDGRFPVAALESGRAPNVLPGNALPDGRPADATGPLDQRRRLLPAERSPSDSGPVLGVTVTNTNDGVTVQTVVPESPAAVAGLRPGDVITAVDGTAINDGTALAQEIQRRAAGGDLELQVKRGDEAVTLTARLAARPAPTPAAPELGGLLEQVLGSLLQSNGDAQPLQALLGQIVQSAAADQALPLLLNTLARGFAVAGEDLAERFHSLDIDATGEDGEPFRLQAVTGTVRALDDDGVSLETADTERRFTLGEGTMFLPEDTTPATGDLVLVIAVNGEVQVVVLAGAAAQAG